MTRPITAGVDGSEVSVSASGKASFLQPAVGDLARQNQYYLRLKM